MVANYQILEGDKVCVGTEYQLWTHVTQSMPANIHVNLLGGGGESGFFALHPLFLFCGSSISSEICSYPLIVHQLSLSACTGTRLCRYSWIALLDEKFSGLPR